MVLWSHGVRPGISHVSVLSDKAALPAVCVCVCADKRESTLPTLDFQFIKGELSVEEGTEAMKREGST